MPRQSSSILIRAQMVCCPSAWAMVGRLETAVMTSSPAPIVCNVALEGLIASNPSAKFCAKIADARKVVLIAINPIAIEAITSPVRALLYQISRKTFRVRIFIFSFVASVAPSPAPDSFWIGGIRPSI